MEGITDRAQFVEAANTIRDAILKSQQQAVRLVNQEQLALYFGIGRYVSQNSRKKNWGSSVLKNISEILQKEWPGLRGFGERNLKNMRTFYEAWRGLESNSAIAIAELQDKTAIANAESAETSDDEDAAIRRLQLTGIPDFPLTDFLSISFTHHIRIIESTKDMDERLFYIRYCNVYKPTTEALPQIIRQDLFHHQGTLPNNFISTLPEYKQAYRAIQMLKDEYLLDFINVEQLGMHDEEIDERVIESNIVHNVKNFIMTFGRGFAFIGNQFILIN